MEQGGVVPARHVHPIGLLALNIWQEEAWEAWLPTLELCNPSL